MDASISICWPVSRSALGRCKRGIRETLKYLAFLQVQDPDTKAKQYVHDNTEDDIFGSKCKGLLAIRDLDRETQSFDEQFSEMKVLQASGLENDLPKMIREAFGSL